MNSNYTHVSILLDKSGSMASIRNDTIGGFNSFMESQRKTPGKCTVSLSLFDDRYEGRKMTDISKIKYLDAKSYVPGGSTALFGGIGRLIEETGRALESMPESDRPGKVVFLIITDGEENHSPCEEWSRAYTADKLKDAITLQQGTYGWQFVYIGANQDSILNATQLGIHRGNVINYSANVEGTQSLYSAVSSNLRSYATGQSGSMAWKKEQLDDQEKAKDNN